MDYALTTTGHVQTWNLHTGDAWVIHEVYAGDVLTCTEMSKNGVLTTPACIDP